MSRRNRNRQPVAVHHASEDRRIQEDRAHAAYHRLVADTLERQHSATASGAIPTRMDAQPPWAWGFTGSAYTQGGVLQPDTWSIAALRERARMLEENNWLACSVLDRSVENVIGTGIQIKPRTESADFNEQARKLWQKWTNGTQCDARGTYTFAAIQRHAYRAKLRDGDIGTLLAEEEFEGKFTPRLQLIEPDRIRSATSGPQTNGNQIVDGVEMNASGRPVAFLVETYANGATAKPTKIAANDFIFVHRSVRYGDVRGESAFGGGFTLFDMIMGYLESVVVSSRIGASQAMIAKRKNPASTIGGLGFQYSATTGKKERLMPIQPGMINVIDIEEDLQPFSPSQPTQSFPESIAAFARFVGLKFGLTLEQVMLDFSRTSYSSSRAARIQAEATASVEQEDFAVKFVSRIYQWFISKQVKYGNITGKVPDEFWTHEWIPQGRPWVDPTKEIDAAAKAVSLGIDARSFIAMERGYDFTKLTEQNAADVKLLKDAGLPTDTTASKSPFSGQPIQPDNQPNPNDQQNNP